MPVIYLVRHGQASFGAENYDALSETGWEQSRVLGRHLLGQDLGVPRVVCGAMRRHRETAEAALKELGLPDEWSTDSGFDEYDHKSLLRVHWPESGDRAALASWMEQQEHPRRAFQARFEEALRRWQRNEDPYNETWPAFRERVLAALYSLANGLGRGDSALVFSSGGAISVAIQHLLELDEEALITFNRGLVNTSVTRLLVNAGNLRLATLNEHLHLSGELLTYR
ncbi:histidine phosphatase family protein [Alloalcanivorax mobilis]|uniref:histidine phosphatase family protein n=1 Tax=Alloalcanivorax mobilis TaxID=2019569 RepID=UPI000B5B2541|nr:histidine phosphatase family protein [Alloalcanivorax mobilis]ASK35589.1 histidine phosphatase family protein [Alcanivorax sp. N3-2A]|tara:strand:+ start:16335 stop:17012 length:678 start_codon:yes stop_codon:yes gene_type:complete